MTPGERLPSLKGALLLIGLAGASLPLPLGGEEGERAIDAKERRPLLKLDESEQAEVGSAWRGSTVIGGKKKPPPPRRMDVVPKSAEGGEGEEPTLPGMVSAGKLPALKMRYQGVAPGRAELPPRPPRLPIVKGPQLMTWPGFQVKEGKPTIFLQLTGPVEYSVSEGRGQVVLTLQDTAVRLRNNLRPLRVESFGTMVKNVHFARRKNTLTVTISVKGQVAHRERLEPAENGYSMLVLQLEPMGKEAADDKDGGAPAPKKQSQAADED